jgi:hypothetical protein
MRWIKLFLGQSRCFDRRRMGIRASISFTTALLFPGMVAGTGLGVEAAGWGFAKVSGQRAADIAAIAGAINYKANTNYTSTTNVAAAQRTAATFGARMAQLNGGVATVAPSWDATTPNLDRQSDHGTDRQRRAESVPNGGKSNRQSGYSPHNLAILQLRPIGYR